MNYLARLAYARILRLNARWGISSLNTMQMRADRYAATRDSRLNARWGISSLNTVDPEVYDLDDDEKTS